jgi:putative ABC transport system permease protein
MLRVLGLPQRRIAGAYALEFGLVWAVLASAAGVLMGLAVHLSSSCLLAGLVDRPLPPPGACRRCSAWVWA